jgi:hypothetical protein
LVSVVVRLTDVCIFCGRPWGEVSKSSEHVLARGLHKHAGDLPNARTSRSGGLTFDAFTQEFVEHPLSAPYTRNSSLLNLRTRAVCESCNNGCLSRLEQAAKPQILALADAAEHGHYLLLSRSDALLVSRWAQKTAITHELTSRGERVGDASMGMRISDGKAIRGSNVWLARNQDDLDLRIGQAQIEISDTPVVQPGDPYRQILISAITWHYLTFLVYIPDADTLGKLGPHYPMDRWLTIWPCGQSGIEYPPTRSISEPELNSALSNHQSWLPFIRSAGVRQAG